MSDELIPTLRYVGSHSDSHSTTPAVSPLSDGWFYTAIKEEEDHFRVVSEYPSSYHVKPTLNDFGAAIVAKNGRVYSAEPTVASSFFESETVDITHAYRFPNGIVRRTSNLIDGPRGISGILYKRKPGEPFSL